MGEFGGKGMFIDFCSLTFLWFISLLTKKSGYLELIQLRIQNNQVKMLPKIKKIRKIASDIEVLFAP